MQHTNTSSMSSGSTTCLFYPFIEIWARARPSAWQNAANDRNAETVESRMPVRSQEKKVSSATKSEAYNEQCRAR